VPSESKVLNQTYLVPDETRQRSRFRQSASGYWRGRSAWPAWLLLVALIAAVLLLLLTQYRLNFCNRDFFNAIEVQGSSRALALRFVPLSAASLTLTVFSVWARMTLQRCWREWLSNHLYDVWLNEERYKRHRFVAGDYEAPEFRIAEDARIATDRPVDLVLGLFLVTANATFIGILWSGGDSLPIAVRGLALTIPGYVGIAVIAYSILLSAAIILIARHLTRVMEENKRTEAELRSVGTYLLERGEGLVLDRNKDPRHTVGAALKAVIAIWRIYCWQLMRTTVVTYTSLLITSVIGLLLCIPKISAAA
jgi:putative ATP-binding cassette transporter